MLFVFLRDISFEVNLINDAVREVSDQINLGSTIDSELCQK